MTTKKFAVALTALVGAPMVVTAGTASAAPEPLAFTSKYRPVNTPGAPERALDNYAIIVKEMEARPTLWGGAFVDGSQLVIKFVGQSRGDATSTLARLGVRDAIRLQESTVSLVDLESAVSSISNDPSVSQVVSTVGPDYADSSVALGVESMTPGVESALLRLKKERGINGRAYRDHRGKPTSRYFAAPYYIGSHAIGLMASGGSTYSGCSMGFNLYSSDGYGYAVTASHCWQPTPNSSLQPVVNRIQSDGSLRRIGAATWSSAHNGVNYPDRFGDLLVYRYDGDAQQPSSSSGTARVYEGPGNVESKSSIITGIREFPQGYQTQSLRMAGSSGYFNNNSTYGYIGPDWISLVNQVVTYTNGLKYNQLTVAEDESECVHGGDSGGPVFLQTGSGTAQAVGIISGTNNQGASFTNCRNYYTPIKYVPYPVKTG